MKKIIQLLTILMMVSGLAFAQQGLPDKVKEDCTTVKSSGCIDWENGIIYASGLGVPNPAHKDNPAQSRYGAKLAAEKNAEVQLLQMIQGINISSTTTVKDGMLESQVINSSIQGTLYRVENYGPPREMNDGSVWVTKRMHLKDIRKTLLDNGMFESGSGSGSSNSGFVQESAGKDKVEPVPEPILPKSPEYGGSPDKIYSGLIIDARDSGVVPAMSPKIYAPDGKEVYGSQIVERDFVLQYGIAGYSKELDDAKSNDRVKGNPLLIKAELRPGKTSDLTISSEDAELLKQLESSQSFMREARVLIVL